MIDNINTTKDQPKDSIWDYLETSKKVFSTFLDKAISFDNKEWEPIVEITVGIALSIFVMNFYPVVGALAGWALHYQITNCKDSCSKETELTNGWIKIERFFIKYKTEFYVVGLFFATFTPLSLMTVPLAMRASYAIRDMWVNHHPEKPENKPQKKDIETPSNNKQVNNNILDEIDENDETDDFSSSDN